MPSWIDLAGHLSFVLTAGSFLLRDILLLRAMAVLSGLVGVVYNASLPSGPLWLVIFWLSIFVLINLVQIGRLMAERRAVTLSGEEQELLDTLFVGLSPVEMMKLVRAGTWQSLPDGHLFTLQGAPVQALSLLSSGEVQVLRDGQEVDRSRDGMLIGEVSFVGGSVASAEVRATRPCRALVWAQDDLRALLTRNPSLALSLQGVLAADLAAKLRGRTAPVARDPA